MAIEWISNLESIFRTLLTECKVWSSSALEATRWTWLMRAGIMAGLFLGDPTTCPGYRLVNVTSSSSNSVAILRLAGESCNHYGADIEYLRVSVDYETATRLHVKIEDAAGLAYQVPHHVLGRPGASAPVEPHDAELRFVYTSLPFTFAVVRSSTGEVLFNSSAANLIFEDQYIRLRTSLPSEPNLYGLGEHSDNLRLNTTGYVRTLWNRDSGAIPAGSNLYGYHPVYFDHRGDAGTHGVFLLTSVGMDIKIDSSPEDGQYLEYNLLGGVLDLYFLAGPSPVQVAQQYSDVVGKAAMQPYWSFGLHHCRYGYRDYYAIAEVVYNYSLAGIPLETMWTDIDYMFDRYIMTTDPDRYPISRVQDYVDYLHQHHQHYIVMVDPAIAYQPEREHGHAYETFLRGREEGLFLQKNGSIYRSVVWPGITAYPDWFHPKAPQFWIDQFASFFHAERGVDIDGLWIDMNEATNFNYFGDDPEQTARQRNVPPPRLRLRSGPRPLPGFPAAFQPDPNSPYPPDSLAYTPPWLVQRENPDVEQAPLDPNSQHPVQSALTGDSTTSKLIGYPDRDLLSPPYRINNENSIHPYGGLSNYTIDTDIIHEDGHAELDVHNLYGSMMSRNSRAAMEARRPNRRPFVITRSTFAGDGRNVGKWLGDNLSTWQHYRQSIQGMLDFVALYQMPMVGSDVCGFGDNTTETLCARWTTLGAFNPFYRNHNADNALPQEFYLWPVVTKAAQKAIDVRYRLLDYIYTALHQQSKYGIPMLSPLFFLYPHDTATFAIDLQFFYGPGLLISPVTDENSTSVTIYLPDGLFFDFYTFKPIQGKGSHLTLTNIDFDEIPIHIKAGVIIPMRSSSAMTTKEVRKQPFNILIAPDEDGQASGRLYIDDGDSIVQKQVTDIEMRYESRTLTIYGNADYFNQDENNDVLSVTLLGVTTRPGHGPYVSSGEGGVMDKVADEMWQFNEERDCVNVTVNMPLKNWLIVKF